MLQRLLIFRAIDQCAFTVARRKYSTVLVHVVVHNKVLGGDSGKTGISSSETGSLRFPKKLYGSARVKFEKICVLENAI